MCTKEKSDFEIKDEDLKHVNGGESGAGEAFGTAPELEAGSGKAYMYTGSGLVEVDQGYAFNREQGGLSGTPVPPDQFGAGVSRSIP